MLKTSLCLLQQQNKFRTWKKITKNHHKTRPRSFITRQPHDRHLHPRNGGGQRASPLPAAPGRSAAEGGPWLPAGPEAASPETCAKHGAQPRWLPPGWAATPAAYLHSAGGARAQSAAAARLCWAVLGRSRRARRGRGRRRSPARQAQQRCRFPYRLIRPVPPAR